MKIRVDATYPPSMIALLHCDHITELVGLIEYKSTSRIKLTNKYESVFLQYGEATHCANNPDDISTQYGRKWYMSQHMTDSEIIQTIFLAVTVWEEHERRERFRLDGKAIFGPLNQIR